MPSPQARANVIASNLFNVERARLKEWVAARNTQGETAVQQAFEVAQAAADKVRMPAAVVLSNPSRASQPRTVCLRRRLSHSSLSTPRRAARRPVAMLVVCCRRSLRHYFFSIYVFAD